MRNKGVSAAPACYADAVSFRAMPGNPAQGRAPGACDPEGGSCWPQLRGDVSRVLKALTSNCPCRHPHTLYFSLGHHQPLEVPPIAHSHRAAVGFCSVTWGHVPAAVLWGSCCPRQVSLSCPSDTGGEWGASQCPELCQLLWGFPFCSHHFCMFHILRTESRERSGSGESPACAPTVGRASSAAAQSQAAPVQGQRHYINPHRITSNGRAVQPQPLFQLQTPAAVTSHSLPALIAAGQAQNRCLLVTCTCGHVREAVRAAEGVLPDLLRGGGFRGFCPHPGTLSSLCPISRLSHKPVLFCLFL